MGVKVVYIATVETIYMTALSYTYIYMYTQQKRGARVDNIIVENEERK